MWDRIFEIDTWPARLARLAHWVYRTHMSTAWIGAYGWIIYVSWERIPIELSLIFAVMGSALFLLTCFSHIQDLSIYRRARNAVDDFASAAYAELKGQPASPTMKARTKELNTAMARLHRWLWPSVSSPNR